MGDEFRSDWGGETSVELRLDESRIIRTKGKENTYQINDNEPLKAFGKDVPVEISKILNIDESNIQQQLDSPFLLTQSPGEVAKHFNHIAHLEQIDKSLSFLNSGIKKINQTITNDTTNKERLQTKLDQYDYLDKVEIELEVLEEMEADKVRKLNALRELTKLYNSILETKAEIKEKSGLLVFESELDIILDEIEQQKAKQTEYDMLEALINRISGAKQSISRHQSIVAVESTVIELETLILSKKAVEKKYAGLDTLLDGLFTIGEDMEKLRITLKEKEIRFHKEMPEKCFLCGK